MDKTTLRQKSKKELLNIANELGLKVTTKHTIDMLIEGILEALARNPAPRSASGTKPKSETEGAPGKSAAKKSAPGKAPETRAKTAAAKAPQESAAEKKMFLSPKYSGEDVRDLPKGYGDTKIVAMVRDPHWIFVYWEINHEKRQILTKMGVSTERLILRAYDITDIIFDGFNANNFFDIEINDNTDNWYVRLPSSARSWCVDLGAIDKNGGFVLVARSNTVITPREIPSSRRDAEPRFAPTDAVFNVLLKITAEGTAVLPQSSEEGAQEGEDTKGGSELMSGILPISSGSNLSSLSPLSSIGLASSLDFPKKPKDFWLIVNTELIVYGATEPDAKLTVQGHPVQLRPDGTFSMRFALPDGQQIIPVRAVNADGDMSRCITPIVQRRTETE